VGSPPIGAPVFEETSDWNCKGKKILFYSKNYCANCAKNLLIFFEYST